MDYLLFDFKRSYTFTMFACRYETEQTMPENDVTGGKRMVAEQFGRGV